MATTSHPHTPPRQSKRKLNTALDNLGLGVDDEDFATPPGVTRKVRPRTPLGPQSPNAATAPVYVGTARDLEQSEEEEEERQTSDQPPASKAKRKKLRSDYRPVEPQYADMTAERLFTEGHVATGSFFLDHMGFAKQAARFNDVKIAGKAVWQKQPIGTSTLHNNIVVAEHFPSLAPLLVPLGELCKPRPSTTRRFKKQRVQQYTKSGRRHRDGKNAEWRMCITVHDPAAPSDFKQLEIGMAEASTAEGGKAVNPFRTKADGTPDSTLFDCSSASYHIMDTVGTGYNSHAHHQAIIAKKSILAKHGAATTFVIDMDPINPDTFIEDVDAIAMGTAGALGPNAGCESALVPPPTPEQIGVSCGSQQTKDWTVAGAMAREEAAKEAVAAAVTEEAAAAAKDNLDDATKKRKLTVKARDDQSTGARTSTVRGQRVTVSEAAWEGRAAPTPLEREAMDQSSADSSRGAFNSGPGFNGVGKPFNSGVGAAARDFGDEGAGKKYYGLHLDIPTKYLAAQLPFLV
ncbi:unnamed protein product [Pylaiella littoralis]